MNSPFKLSCSMWVQYRISGKKSGSSLTFWIGDNRQDTPTRYCSRCSCNCGVDQWKAYKAPIRADVDRQTWCSFVLVGMQILWVSRAWKWFKLGSKEAADPSSQEVVTSMTRLIEDASHGRKWGSQILWRLLPPPLELQASTGAKIVVPRWGNFSYVKLKIT